MSTSRNQSTGTVVAQLVEKISRKLSLPLSESFQDHIKAGYCKLPVATLVKGDYTVGQQFAIIRTSIKELKDEVESPNSTLPWEELWNIALDIIEKISLSPTTANIPLVISTTPGRKSSDKPQPVKPTTTASGVKSTGDAESGSGLQQHPKPSQPSAPTDQNMIRQIREVVLKDKASGSRPLYDRKGQRYVKCKAPDCRFCSKMYDSLHLTSCERFGHPPCNSAGWFPHVGITMWKSLRRQHDAGAEFVAKPSTPKYGELPNLSAGERATAPVPVQTGASPKRKRLDEMDPISPSSSSSWADEMDAASV